VATLYLHLGRFRPSTIDDDPSGQASYRGGTRDTTDNRLVYTLDAVPRMGQTSGEVAVVRQEDYPLRVVVQSPDGVHVLAYARHEVEHRPSTLRIGACGHVADGLVEKQVPAALGTADTPSVNPDVISLGIGTAPELRDDLAVHRHTASRDHALGSTP
jgi:hypothetical protein